MIDHKDIVQICDKHHFNGVILISENNQITNQIAHGYADFDHKVPLEINTKMRIASLTKQITAFAILQLYYKKMLDLSDPISKYFNDFPLNRKITIHHLLSNSSGIRNFALYDDYSELTKLDHNSFYEMFVLKIILPQEIQFEPGEKFEYSVSGYLILTSIIEKVSGLTYHDYLKQNIFDKLGMNDTGFDFSDSKIAHKAVPYDEENGLIKPAYPIDLRIAGGGGGLYSTIIDFHKWHESLRKYTLLPKKMIDLMFTKHIKIMENVYYGYGIFIDENQVNDKPSKRYYHTGGGPGVQAISTLFVEKNLLLVMITNVNSKLSFHPTRTDIYDLIYQL